MSERDYQKEAEDLMKKVLETIKVGQIWVKYSDLPVRHPNRRKYHIRAIVDDDMYVVRFWLRHKQRWHYECLWAYELGLYLESGNLKRVKK